METTLIASPMGILAAIVGNCVLFFWIERQCKPKLFQYAPPLIWIYILPLFLVQWGILPSSSETYTVLKNYGLPLFLIAMLIEIDIKAAFGVMRGAMAVTLFGTVGIVVGLGTGFAVVSKWLSPEAWKGYGALAGSWIGGTGNMVAVSEALETPSVELGLAIIADNVGYLIWLPLVLVARNYAKRFAKFSKAPEDRVQKMVDSQAHLHTKSKEMGMYDFLGILCVAFAVAAISEWAVPYLLQIPVVGELFGKTTWKVLMLTSIAIPLSMTPIRNLRGNQPIASAIIYMFVAVMGAQADISGLAQAPMFVLGAIIAIAIHLAFLLWGARVCKMDVHTTAIASAANIGGAATAPIVAGYHNEKLVPMSVLLALVGYAVGNYAAIAAAYLCKFFAVG